MCYYVAKSFFFPFVCYLLRIRTFSPPQITYLKRTQAPFSDDYSLKQYSRTTHILYRAKKPLKTIRCLRANGRKVKLFQNESFKVSKRVSDDKRGKKGTVITYKKSLFSELRLQNYGQNTFDDLQKGAFWDIWDEMRLPFGTKRGAKERVPPPMKPLRGAVCLS